MFRAFCIALTLVCFTGVFAGDDVKDLPFASPVTERAQSLKVESRDVKDLDRPSESVSVIPSPETFGVMPQSKHPASYSPVKVKEAAQSIAPPETPKEGDVKSPVALHPSPENFGTLPYDKDEKAYSLKQVQEAAKDVTEPVVEVEETRPEPTAQEAIDDTEAESGMGAAPALVVSADQAKDVASQDYRLRVGDTLRISIYGEVNTERAVTIDNHGGISYLLVGRITAVGMTLDELRQELNKRMAKQLQYAIVNVVPVEFGGMHYTILGQVNDPGKKPISGKVTVIEAISQAGGFRMGFFRSGTREMADLNHAFLARKGDVVPVDFQGLVTRGDLEHNVEIQDGDFIFVPSVLERHIYVLGEVRLPANIGYLNSETLVGALAKARGLTHRAGRWVYIIRGSLYQPEKIEVNVKDLFGGAIPDIVLKPGDIVYVPKRDGIFWENVLQAGLRSFVFAFFNVAGRETFEALHPHAEDDDSSKFFFP